MVYQCNRVSSCVHEVRGHIPRSKVIICHLHKYFCLIVRIKVCEKTHGMCTKISCIMCLRCWFHGLLETPLEPQHHWCSSSDFCFSPNFLGFWYHNKAHIFSPYPCKIYNKNVSIGRFFEMTNIVTIVKINTVRFRWLWNCFEHASKPFNWCNWIIKLRSLKIFLPARHVNVNLVK